VLFIQNLPPVTTAELPITEPSLYFGELASDYVLVRTNTRIPPARNDSVTTYYQGAAGVPVGGFFRRLLSPAVRHHGHPRDRANRPAEPHHLSPEDRGSRRHLVPF
jgi:uncharacterized membrane protein (UPF0182 family)